MTHERRKNKKPRNLRWGEGTNERVSVGVRYSVYDRGMEHDLSDDAARKQLDAAARMAAEVLKGPSR